MKNRLIGDRKFYARVLALAVPIMIQNGITNLVSMLDNIMVGRIGTVEMTGVAVTNQLIFVFNLCIFGAVSGAGIFGAQFYGNGDTEGVRDTFRFKVLFCTAVSIIGIAVLYFYGQPLINLYLRGEGETDAAQASYAVAREYMNVMLAGLIPYALVQCYSSTLRETDNAVLPMVAGVIAVAVNLSLNYVLIFGNFGAPKMGAKGAAVATVISRFAELATVAVYTRIKADKNKFIIGAYKSIKVPAALVKDITVRGMPLMVNETLWAASVAVLNQCYSVRGLTAVAANNICQTFFNVFSVAFMAVGAAIGIILGQILGSGDTDRAKDTAAKLMAFSVMVSVAVSAVYFIAAEFIPSLYNTNDEVRRLAASLMRISALIMPLDAFANASYFTIRSGGKVFITFLFDSVFMMAISVPVAFVLSRCTSLSVLYLYAICQSLSFIKDVIGYIFVKNGSWARKIVDV